MLRKIAFVGAVAAAAAWFPAWFEENPDVLERLVAPEAAEPPAPAVRVVQTTRMAPAAELPLGRNARLERDGRGHYSGRFRLNGRDIDGMVDTGATVVAINVSTARRIGIELLPDDFRYEVDTANGRTRAAMSRLSSLQVGRVHVEDVEVVVLEDRALSTTLIGMSFLNRLKAYRVENGALVMEQ
jgi:aspartyl protease family protein